MASLPDYAELHCLSNFSFLRGASHPDELVAQAAQQGYAALALTDECSLAGVVRAHQAARQAGLKLIVGSEMTTTTESTAGPGVDGLKLVFLAKNREGYGNLSALITLARRRAEKGDLHLAAPRPQCRVAERRGTRLPGAVGAGRRRRRSTTGAGWPNAFPAVPGSPSNCHAGPDDGARLESLQALGDCLRPAAGRRRRRAHACQIAAPGAGCADRAAPQDHGVRCRLRAVPERRTTSAHAPAPGAAVSAGIAGGNAEHRRAMQFLARRTALRIPGGNRAGRRDARFLAAPGDRARPAPALPAGRAGQGAGAHRARTGADRRDGLRSLFPDRVRHRPLRPQPENPLPGARLGGQFGGVLRARHHRGRSGALGHAVRALHLEGTRRAAGHRRRFRARAARGGHRSTSTANTAANARRWRRR